MKPLHDVVSPEWLEQAAALESQFRAGDPFPLVVLDDFLVAEVAHDLVSEFPDLAQMPRSRDYVFGKKHELSSVEAAGPAGAAFAEAMTSPDFSAFLHQVTGCDVFVDPQFHGGGFHQGGDGSYLDLHVDFNVHPLHADWLRTLNLLVYLNPSWDDAWGGQLLVKREREAAPREISPAFNRAVLMLTNETTYHGYRRVQAPPGITRRSIATYAYRHTSERVTPRTTGWAPEEAGPAKRLLARYYNGLVRTKNRLLGSGTARNR